jgi:translation initiation factor 4G
MYFSRIEFMINNKELNSRMRFMLMDVVDMRKSGWQTAEKDKGPKTIQEVREEAIKAQQEKEAASKASRNSRPQPGRGDARSFQGGGYGMNPGGYHDNKSSGTITTDELRKLNARSRQINSGPQNFGPASMLGPRGSGSRRGLGPGTNRDDSGTPRTATPPAPASTSSPNMFSALSEATQHDGHDATSPPPSNANSPQVSNAKPVVEEA